MFAEPRIANQVVHVAGDTVTYGQLADIVDRQLGGKIERVLWNVPKLRAELARDPDDPIKKYRAAGLAFGAGSGFYAAVKFAVEGLSQSLALEVAALGIRVTLVETGVFRTDFLSDHFLRARWVAIDGYEPTVGAVLALLRDWRGNKRGSDAGGGGHHAGRGG